MRRFLFPALLLALLPVPSFGLATSEVGPQPNAHPQPGWPAGMVDLLRHGSRVFSVWVNGNENIYLHAKPAEIEELLKLYSALGIRDHQVFIKKGEGEAGDFKGGRIAYNVNLHILDGIALAMTRGQGAAVTHEPTLTIHVSPAEEERLKRIAIPDNIILESDLPDWPKGKALKPKRRHWHAAVQFADGTPAADFENNVSTTITLWEKDRKEGFTLGQVSHEGTFRAAFSDEEMARLKKNELWLTLTVGNHMSEKRGDDALLPVEKLVLDPTQAKPTKVGKPRYYFGRILFEDGQPAILGPKAGRDPQIGINWSYAGRVHLDEEGYFKVFFTPAQMKVLKARKLSKNVYLPHADNKNRATAAMAFPAEDLSQEKERAGELRIARPGFWQREQK